MASTKEQVEILFNLKYPMYESARAGSINMGESGTKCRKYVTKANAYKAKLKDLANADPAEIAALLRRSLYTIERCAQIVAEKKLPDDGYEQTNVQRQAYKSLCEKKLWSDVRAGFLPYVNPNTFEKFDHTRFTSSFFPLDGLVRPDNLMNWNAPEIEVTGELLEAYFDKPYAVLPDKLRKYVDTAFYPCPDYWDRYTREERERQINEYDLQNNPARQVENKSGWWIYSMDADSWWQAESVSPIHAAMLLSGHNPNTETVEDAETSTNEEMGPEDFRTLKNVFDGASNKQKTLKDWAAYARARRLKIHSWICDWEAWIREVGTKELAIGATTTTQFIDAATPIVVPGKMPRTANNKLAVEAAWELECKLKRRATAKEVMGLLIEWARTGENGDILKEAGKDGRSVEWITTKGRQNNYSIDALEKTLDAWHKSRN